jgi:VanZ family protein
MKLKYITILPAVIVMVIIFLFSSKQGENSNESSMAIAGRILTAYENVTNSHLSDETRLKVMKNINHVVRKGSHFGIYLVLSCTFAFHLLMLKKRGKMLLLIPILLSTVYASTDEFHQLFVPGRSGMITDVLIDTSGAVLGSLMFTAVVLLCSRLGKKHRKTVILPE